MEEIFGVKVDTYNMTLEELTDVWKKTRYILAILEHDILGKQMAERKYSSTKSTTS